MPVNQSTPPACRSDPRQKEIIVTALSARQTLGILWQVSLLHGSLGFAGQDTGQVNISAAASYAKIAMATEAENRLSFTIRFDRIVLRDKLFPEADVQSTLPFG